MCKAMLAKSECCLETRVRKRNCRPWLRRAMGGVAHEISAPSSGAFSARPLRRCASGGRRQSVLPSSALQTPTHRPFAATVALACALSLARHAPLRTHRRRRHHMERVQFPISPPWRSDSVALRRPPRRLALRPPVPVRLRMRPTPAPLRVRSDRTLEHRLGQTPLVRRHRRPARCPTRAPPGRAAPSPPPTLTGRAPRTSSSRWPPSRSAASTLHRP